MRIALGVCVLLCLVILGFGVHLVFQEQRQVMSFSVTTTAVVLKKQIEEHQYENRNLNPSDPDYPTRAFEPVVTNIGMVPVAVALPSTGLAQLVKSEIAISIVGAFIGLLLGGLGGWLAAAISGQGTLAWIQWMGYATVIGVALFAVLGLLARPAGTSQSC